MRRCRTAETSCQEPKKSDFFLSQVCFWTLRENAEVLGHYLKKGYRPFRNQQEINSGFRRQRWENALGSCINASAEAANLLLDHGADPNIVNRSGQTPLRQALQKLSYRDVTYVSTIEKLLDNGADPNVLMNYRHSTVLDYANYLLSRAKENINSGQLSFGPQEEALVAVIDLLTTHGARIGDSLVSERQAKPYIEPPSPIPVQ